LVGLPEPFDNIAMASWYRSLAMAFMQNAKILNQAFREKGEAVVGNRMAVPFYYLISHTSELLLKCALLKRGFPSSELTSANLRHSLEKLLDELLKKGVPVSDSCQQLLRKLSRQHERHALRYTVFVDDGKPVFTPDPDDLFAMLDELTMAGRIATHGI
jgi:hypothetical protein